MNNLRKFMKNTKAISPIFATLILIAIAVIAGVVVYMFTSGTLATMTQGGTVAQEKVSIQGVSNGAVYAQNTGSGTVTITSLIIKDSTGAVVGTPAAPTGGAALASGALVPVTFAPLTTAGTYTVTLVTSHGGNFVSTSFVV